MAVVHMSDRIVKEFFVYTYGGDCSILYKEKAIHGQGHFDVSHSVIKTSFNHFCTIFHNGKTILDIDLG